MDNELVTGYLERVQSDCPSAIPKIDLQGLQVSMGRGIGNTVIWESLQISRRHCVMEFKNQQWKIKDTSTNGMLINSRRIPQNHLVDLRDGDVISLVPTGALQYRFRAGPPPAPVKANPSPPQVSQAVMEVSPASTSQRSNPESVFTTPNSAKSPKRKSGPSAPQNPEKKRKRLGLNAVNSVVEAVLDDDEEESIDESPSFFIKPVQTSTPISSRNDENEFDLFAPPSDDAAQLRHQLMKCQQRVKDLEGDKLLAEYSKHAEVSRLKNQVATCESEKRIFQEETYKQMMEVLEHEFSCCICNEVFIQATVIDCGHTFCAHCISEWAKRKQECPNCRKPIRNQAKHVEVENFVIKFHTLFSQEIRNKRDIIVSDRKKEVDLAAEAHRQAQAASRQRGRPGPFPMEAFEPHFDFFTDLNNLRRMLAPRGMHQPNLIPQGHAHAHPDVNMRPFGHENLLNFPFPDFMRTPHNPGPPPPPPTNARRRSQRINHERIPAQVGPRSRARAVQQVPNVVTRPHVADYVHVPVPQGPMDILTVD